MCVEAERAIMKISLYDLETCMHRVFWSLREINFGIVLAPAWTCNDSRYSVAVRAYIMVADGNRSNEVRYTVHCNGG